LPTEWTRKPTVKVSSHAIPTREDETDHETKQFYCLG
jgi:hypothetical protein